MSTFNEPTNPENAKKGPRPAQQQRSTLLFDKPAVENSHLSRKSNRDITAVSLSIDTPFHKIPTLKPQNTPDNALETDSQSLKDSQLHYLEANKSLARQAIQDAEMASKILAESKVTQLALLDTLEKSQNQATQNNQYIEKIDTGLTQCQKLLRESHFIFNEIQKIHTKIEHQNAITPTDEHLSEVHHFIAKLQNSQKALEEHQHKMSTTENNAQQALENINKELKSCSTLREKLEEKDHIIAQEFEQYQNKIKNMIQEAQKFIDASEDSLKHSKHGQTSYIALSREINALRHELQNHKKNTTNLSVDLESANKAIALNKVAVEALTNDMHSIKENLLSSKNYTSDEDNQYRESLEQLLSDTKAAHKRMNQLLQLNNAVNDRLTKIDVSVSNNAQRQDNITQEQQQALEDLQQQREACKRLIEQANRSHTLIVNACKKTSQLAEQIENTTNLEKKYREDIIQALQNADFQQSSLSQLESQLKDAQSQQIAALEELKKTQSELKNREKVNIAQLAGLDQKTQELEHLIPSLRKVDTEGKETLATVVSIIKEQNKSSEELRQLQTAITESHNAQSKAQENLAAEVADQLEDARNATEEMKRQQVKLASLEENFSAHISHIDSLARNIQQKMNELQSKHSNNETLAKEIEYSNTELRYLKEQCDQLIQECLRQSQLVKNEEEVRTQSMASLKKMQDKVQNLIQNHDSQENEIGQLSSLTQNALHDLNHKLDQFQKLQQKTAQQQHAIENIQKNAVETQQEQTQLQKQTRQAVNAVKKYLDEVSTKEDRLASLEESLYKQGQEQETVVRAQKQHIDEQHEVIRAQAQLLEKVDETYEQNQKSLETIEQIRQKAQQSFAHLGSQKTKMENAFKEALENIKLHDEKQQLQEKLFEETQGLTQKLVHSISKADDFAKWQEDIKQEIDTKIARIDDYQSRAFNAQQKANAREKQLEQQYSDFQSKLQMLDKMMEDLEETRREEAQFRDELRSLVHQQELQQKDVAYHLSQSQEQHQSLSRSLENAHLMFRENNLATKETQMANKETKLILQEIQREISQIKQSGLKTSQIKEQWDSEKRIKNLESNLDQSHQHQDEIDQTHKQERTRSNDRQQGDRVLQEPFKPSNFML